MVFFFFNDTATTEIYTLSLHDALPIYGQLRSREGREPRLHVRHRHGERRARAARGPDRDPHLWPARGRSPAGRPDRLRSEEHTSELQSRQYLVCRLLLEKKNILYYTSL